MPRLKSFIPWIGMAAFVGFLKSTNNFPIEQEKVKISRNDLELMPFKVSPKVKLAAKGNYSNFATGNAKCDKLKQDVVNVAVKYADWLTQIKPIFTNLGEYHDCPRCGTKCGFYLAPQQIGQGDPAFTWYKDVMVDEEFTNNADLWYWTFGDLQRGPQDWPGKGGKGVQVFLNMEAISQQELDRGLELGYKLGISTWRPRNGQSWLWATYPEESPDSFIMDSAQLNSPQPTHEWLPNDEVAVLYISSRCVGERDGWVSELSKQPGIKVYSMGNCLSHLRGSVPECEDGGGQAVNKQWRNTKKCLQSHFKFTLAVENTRHIDYVTEKLYDPLKSPTIPIYRGAPNVGEYLPGEGSIIDANQMSIPDLAALLKKLDKDPVEYAKYFEWKKKSLRPEYIEEVWPQSMMNLACNICDWYNGVEWVR